MSIGEIIILILGINIAVGFFILGSAIKSGEFEEGVEYLYRDIDEFFNKTFIRNLAKLVIVLFGLFFLISDIIKWIKVKLNRE